ncbi:MAG TPA: hypothetical protein VK879_16520 [Candidatus Sulfomarinibacteraceae bacterium]|nr:hypothetical protein [Candidatus Sulfomarinibacteraceae bacterium]
MTEKQLEQHVKLLGWLHILSHAIFLVIGFFVFVMLVGIGLFAGPDAGASGVMAMIGLFVGGLMLVLALPGLLAGYGLLKRRSWGRLLALIVGILNLFNFPLGTALGVYTLWVLLQNEATDYFNGLKPSMQL